MDLNRLTLLIAGVVAAVLQLLLAPALTFGDATPNFIIATTLALIAADADEPHYLFAFVMGLASDLLGASPVGATAFALVACAWALPFLLEEIGNDSALMSFLVLLVGTLGVFLVYALFLSLTGLVGFVDALVHIVLPCSPYDAAIALALLLIISRLSSGRSPRGGTTMSNVRFN